MTTQEEATLRLEMCNLREKNRCRHETTLRLEGRLRDAQRALDLSEKANDRLLLEFGSVERANEELEEQLLASNMELKRALNRLWEEQA